jgi:hypothetical protein
MTGEKNGPEDAKADISLFEFYAIGIERLVERAPWELEQAVSAYHESFLTEQRCLGLSILLLLGENHVPQKTDDALPGFEEQARTSVNQAVFLRALRHYFSSKKLNPARAEMVLERMQSYIKDSKDAQAAKKDPLEAMFLTIVKRVPPLNEKQEEQYAQRVEKIYDYVEGLVQNNLFKRYNITS